MIDRELFNATINEDINLLKTLINQNHNINTLDELSGENLLFKMISFNNEEMANILIELGADVNNSNNTGKTILMEAASRGCSTKFIKKLIKYGADTEKTDNFGGNVLWWTENRGTINFLKSLGLKFKKKISYIQSNTEFFEDYFIVKKPLNIFQ